ncbi:hypothetical protein ASPACDRAFT_1888892 [Aspergillus aculeatus ATCC 16872]|uniref:Uncharacterized protein n=1 Tax=Aspergillus aculeatus (strain ATCC 16872 / CBS 172.66 / WB 5094) TaxID=690307 RepID=A0A1L9WT47_ASPA1|nr:uncharacterized protein ASPACDRAFT_1888892 [Aspergillus aculeatus ATCC 16872]OJJ99302.1 hypothetical protein ASPACDRAFT_1888892 [Aspergillus aculeatus ATCC 16872]
MPIPEEIVPAAKAPPKWKVYTRKLDSLGRLFQSRGLPLRRPPPATVTDPAPFPFLRLPRELRDQIYRELLTVDSNNNNNNNNNNEKDGDNGALWIRYSRRRHRWWDATPYCPARGGPRRPRPRLALGLLRVCQRVRQETLPIVFACNKIWLDASPAQCLAFLASLPPAVSGGIRHLQLWLDVYLDCGMATGTLPHQTPDERAHTAARVHRDLLIPWLTLFPWMQQHMPLLNALQIRLGANRAWHAQNLQSTLPDWLHFYQTGWMEQVRALRQVCTLRVEARLQWCDQLEDGERAALQELRRELRRTSGFEEVAVRWEHGFFLCSAGEQFPTTSLGIVLQRQRGELQDDDDDDDDDGAQGDLVVGAALPDYRPVYTLEDMVCPMVCGFGEPRPPRSPDNCR